MPFVGGRFMTDDEYADARQEALEDAYWEAVEDHGWTCEDCGEMWDPGEVPATRMQPAEVRHDSCRRCGGAPLQDEHGWALTGRQEQDDVPDAANKPDCWRR
jgi:hypothetical protein